MTAHNPSTGRAGQQTVLHAAGVIRRPAMSGLYNLLAATVLLTSACDSFPSGKEATKAGGTRSDSAGSTIVLHEPGNPLPGSGVSARLSATAVFSLDSIPR